MRSPTDCDDRDCDGDDLVVRARTDRDAVGRLYDRFYPIIHRYCGRRLFDRAAAEDVTAEVFLKVAENMHRFDGSTVEEFRCWAFRIATNAVNAHQRRRARREALFSRAWRLGWWDRPGEPEPGASIEGDGLGEDWARVEAAFRRLGPREQAAVSLRYMEGLSFAQVAEILGEREGTLRVVVSRALARLRGDLSLPPAEADAAARGGRCHE